MLIYGGTRSISILKKYILAKDVDISVKIIPQIPDKTLPLSQRKFNKISIINYGWMFVKFFQLLVGL